MTEMQFSMIKIIFLFGIQVQKRKESIGQHLIVNFFREKN